MHTLPTPWMKKPYNCIRTLLMLAYSNTDILMLAYIVAQNVTKEQARNIK